jgi:hypothetical protein
MRRGSIVRAHCSSKNPKRTASAAAGSGGAASPSRVTCRKGSDGTPARGTSHSTCVELRKRVAAARVSPNQQASASVGAKLAPATAATGRGAAEACAHSGATAETVGSTDLS